jgi:adenylate kinase
MITPRIVLVGPQAAGKGTQATKLAQRYKIPYVSPGELFRATIAAKTPLGRKLALVVDAGRLVNNRITNAMMKKRLHQPDCRRGWITDGYPRQIQQARVFQKYAKPDVLISLNLTDQEVIKRLSGRRTCDRGHVYHLKFSPPKKKPGFCDIDGLPLRQRADNKPAPIRRRMIIYRHQTAPMIKWYQGRIPIINIDASQTIAEVNRDIMVGLKKVLWPSSPKNRK